MPPLRSSEDPLPRGLVFFRPGTPPRYRRNRLIFTLFYLVMALALVWPVYPLVSTIEPYVLGLPFAFAWVALWLIAGFAALLILYRSEGR